MKDNGHGHSRDTAVRVIERIVAAPVQRASPPPLIVTFTYRPPETDDHQQVRVTAGSASGPGGEA